MSVYRKATHTDRYLYFKSRNHPQHKHSVVRTIMDRAKNIPSTEEEALRGTKRVAKALTANNYPADFIHKGRQPNIQQGSERYRPAWHGYSALHQWILRENHTNICRGFDTKVAYKLDNLKHTKNAKRQDGERGFQRSCAQYQNVKVVRSCV